MALNTRLGVNARNIQLDALAAALAGGFLKIYSDAGAQPASPDTAPGAAVLLATLALGTPAFPAAAAGVLTANPITGAAAVATGNALWFRATKADGTAMIDGSIGLAAANLILGSIAIQSGGLVNVTAWTHGLPLQGA